MATSADLIFFVNGKKNVLSNPDPEMTLLEYLRSNLQLTGTKLACGEGGCGACTVMVSFCPQDSDTARHLSANACLLPLCSLHGMAVTTVEGIGSLRTRLHPIQERIAAAHGTQCGYCTPGFVMSMYTLLRNSPTPSDQQLDSVFEGNLCRCTGYRPILDAYRPFTKGGTCALGEDCCRNKTSASTGNSLSDGAVSQNQTMSSGSLQNGVQANGDGCESSQEPIFPPYLKLEGSHLQSQSLMFVGPRVRWYRPVSLSELLDIKKHNPDCKLVVGNTEIGVEVKMKKQLYPVLVSATQVPELTSVQHLQTGIQFGASVTLATMDSVLKKAVKELPEEKSRVFAAFVEMLRWFSGHQVRNVAAVGGNIMTASPISDLNPLMLACGATLVLASTDGSNREVKMDDSFFIGYRKTAVLSNEILVSILIPFSQKNEYFFSYKQANRKEDDIAIVNAGMRVVFDDSARVLDLSLAFGGMAPTTVMASGAMKGLVGLKWNEDLLNKACDLLTSDLPLDPGSPGGVTEYRRTLTVSFFFKFYLTVLQQLQQQGQALDSSIKASDQIAAEPLERGTVEGFQWFEVSPEAGCPDSALRKPVVHESAYKQATGEALFINDIAPRQGELYLAFIQSTKARAKLVKVDPSAALSMPGVVDYISHVDIPGKKVWGLGNDDEVFARGEVMYQGQPIGAILANTMANARRAAQAVLIEYDIMEPVITISDAIAKKSFFTQTPVVSSGDVTEALLDVEDVLEGEVHLGAQEHFYMEPHVTIAYPLEDGGVEVHSSTQGLVNVQTAVADALGISLNKVKCRTRRIGGGFGGKETRPPMVTLPVAIAAVKHNRPVRCALERDEDMRMCGTRHPFLAKYKIGFNSSGQILAYDVMFFMNGGYSLDCTYAVSQKALLSADVSYMIPNLRAQARLCKTNLPSCTVFRGSGAPQATVVLETALTQVAAYLDMAPEKLREINLYKEGDVTHYQTVLQDCNLQRCWDDVKRQGQFLQRRREVDLFNSENRWRKRGIAITPTKFGSGFFDAAFLNQGATLVNIYTDGTVLISNGGVEMGQGLHTKVMQVASQVLGVPMSKIQIDETATSVVPNTTASSASVSSDFYGAAVQDACTTLLERLKPVRAKNPNHSWEQLVFAAYLDRIPLSATGFYKKPEVGYDVEKNKGLPYNYYTFGSACCMVEIDCLTGDHQILSTDIVMDLGKSLNPAIDIGQIEGGFTQGYGLVALEQYKVQGDGTLLTRGPGNYKIPSVGNIPQAFNVTLLRESGNPKAVYSSKAVGEPPMLLASSVLCAIHDAVRAARSDEGLDPFVSLHTPVNPPRIRMACSDRFTQKYEGAEKNSDKQPWFVDL